MHKIGLCGNVGGQYPTRLQFRELNPAYFRTILYRTSDLDKLKNVLPGSTRLIVLVNNEHQTVQSDWSGLEAAIQELAPYKNLIAAVEVGNELDLLGVGPEDGAALARRAAPLLKKMGLPTILSSVAGSDWVNWLKRAATLARGAIDGVALHPYGAAADGYPTPSYATGDLAQKITTAAEVSGCPVWVTEMGVKLGEIGGEERAAEWIRRAFGVVESLPHCVAGCLFAYHDANGAPTERGHHAFGLIADETEKPRSGYFAFAALTSKRAYIEPNGASPVPVPPPPKPEPYYVGDGVRKYIAAKKLTLVGNELYFTREASATPTKEGLVFWVQGEGKARLVPWQE